MKPHVVSSLLSQGRDSSFKKWGGLWVSHRNCIPPSFDKMFPCFWQSFFSFSVKLFLPRFLHHFNLSYPQGPFMDISQTLSFMSKIHFKFQVDLTPRGTLDVSHSSVYLSSVQNILGPHRNCFDPELPELSKDFQTRGSFAELVWY